MDFGHFLSIPLRVRRAPSWCVAWARRPICRVLGVRVGRAPRQFFACAPRPIGRGVAWARRPMCGVLGVRVGRAPRLGGLRRADFARSPCSFLQGQSRHSDGRRPHRPVRDCCRADDFDRAHCSRRAKTRKMRFVDTDLNPLATTLITRSVPPTAPLWNENRPRTCAFCFNCVRAAPHPWGVAWARCPICGVLGVRDWVGPSPFGGCGRAGSDSCDAASDQMAPGRRAGREH